MNKKNIPIIVQLKQNNNRIIEGIEQNDAGVLFDMKIMDGLKPFDFSGYTTVTLKIKKPDESFTVDSDKGNRVDVIDPVNGRLKLNIPTSCTAQNGMHFCQIGFGYDEETYFETTSFNYFVGENPNPEDESVTGTDEFPVLTNLIAQVSGMLSAEETRLLSELDRQEAEAGRKTVASALIALFVETLGLLEDLLVESHSMLDEILKALAEGGSVDVSQLTALASKSYVAEALSSLDFGSTEGDKTKNLVIYHGDSDDRGSLLTGELFYDTETNSLYIGNGSNASLINRPPFIAQPTEPTETDKFWVDTSGTVPEIKYYNGSEWISCNTAVFA